MLKLRPSCEHCDKNLPAESVEAMICTFECTFCSSCVSDVFESICPNCGGDFVKRPIRPADLLTKYPVSEKRLFKPADMKAFEELKTRIRREQ